MIDPFPLHMRHVRCLDDDRGVKAFVLDRFRVAQLATAIPPRPAPSGDDSVVVALNVGNFAGFATYCPSTGKQLWLDVLWVEPDYRRRGIAMQLLHEVELTARRRHFRGVALGHETGNAAMIALMERTGWPVDHIVRRKELRP